MDEASTGFHGGEIGLQGTRPAEVLKLWLGLRQLGLDGIAETVTSALERANRFRQHLDQNRLHCQSGRLHLVAFHPLYSVSRDPSAWTLSLRQSLMREGFMLSRPLYAGRHHLKSVWGNPHDRCPHRSPRHLHQWISAMTEQPNRASRWVAIITGAISVAIAVLYLAVITVLDARGPMLPPPPEALGEVAVDGTGSGAEAPPPVAWPSPETS